MNVHEPHQLREIPADRLLALTSFRHLKEGLCVLPCHTAGAHDPASGESGRVHPLSGRSREDVPVQRRGSIDDGVRNAATVMDVL
jgi:hypothetical protein